MLTMEQRADPHEGAAVLERLFPLREERNRAEHLLAEAIRAAHALGGARWALTLNPKYLRLNVGKVEVFALFAGRLHFVLDRTRIPRSLGTTDEPDVYASIPGSVTLNLDVDVDAEVIEQLRPAWHSAIAKAVDSASRSNYRKFHSPGVITHLRSTIAPDLPSPLTGDSH